MGGQKAAKGQQELQAAQNNGTSAARAAPARSSAELSGTRTDTDGSLQKRRFSYLRGKQHQGAPLLTHLTQGRDRGAVRNGSCLPRAGNSLS